MFLSHEGVIAGPSALWEKTFGGPSEDNFGMVRQTTDGGYILVGTTVSYGAGDDDVYLVKTDLNGNKVWQKTFGESSKDSGTCVQRTSDGGYIISGYFNWEQDACLIKTDLNGNLVWQKFYSCGGGGVDTAYHVQQTFDGGYIFVGITNSCGAGDLDIYLVKTDSNGNEVWHKTFGGSAKEHGYCVQQTPDGGYILVGDTRSFGANGMDVYLIKTDSNGSEVWHKTFGGSGDDSGYHMQQTTDGGYIITGIVNYQTGSDNIYLIKTNPNGIKEWEKTFGGSSVEHGQEVQQTSDGGYIIAAYTNSFGAGSYDAYLIKTDSNGNKVWDANFGGPLVDVFTSVQQTSDGGYIAAGLTAHSGSGTGDAYLVKIGSDIAKVTIPVVWQANPDGSGVVTNNNSISRVKLTPDKNNVMVFHYNGGAYGIPTRVDKLDASTGNFVWPLPGYKTVTKPGERISLNGWVDGSGNLFIMGSWSGYTIWKYDSELATELCSYTGGSGFEYVMDAMTDEFDNIYVSGMTGSGSNDGSRLVKLNANCNQIWTCLSKKTSQKDDYGRGIALDSSKNVFRVGTDSSPAYASYRGRLIGHNASNGAEFLNYTVNETNSIIWGITIDSSDYIYIAYCYGYTPSGQERTVVQKLKRVGSTANVVWEHRFEDIGMYLGGDAIVKHTENSFYVAFNLRHGGTTLPGIAEFDLNGNLLWKDTLDRPGWNLASGIDVKGDYIYVGLTNNADGSQTQVLCLKKTVSEPEWSFVQISDTHIGWTKTKCEKVPGAFPPRYRCRLVDARENLAALIYKVMKEIKPAFIVNTGDVADFGCAVSPFVGESCSQGYWDYSQAIAEATDNGIRVYSIPGNHDQRYPWPYQAVCQTFPACFRDPFGNPNSWFMLGGSTFTNDDNILFVVLNTGNGNCSGALTTEDIDFLNGLDKNVPKIILTHHPAVADDGELNSLCGTVCVAECEQLPSHLRPYCYEHNPYCHEYILDGQEEFLQYCEDPTNNVYAVLSGHTHKSHVYDEDLAVPAEYDYTQYVQTGTGGIGDFENGDYPVFRKIDVIGSEVRINDVTEVTKEDYYDYIAAKKYSPGTLHVYDSNGQHTGYEPVNGFERDIPGSFYFSHYEVEDENGVRVLPEEVLIFDPCDGYLYEVVGTEKGTYRLEIIFGQDGNGIVFEANGIPTLPGAVHDYLIDWDLLAQGSNGVTLLVDADGDGTFERTITSDSNLSAVEFDQKPIAEAGSDQTVYAWIDGKAKVVLDGSDSNDPDGDALTYKWTWSVGADTYEANGVNPQIELPVGVHTIQLVVNDGLVDSAEDDVNVTVIAPVQGNLCVMPSTINRRSNQPHILAAIELDNIAKSDINADESLTLYPGGIKATKQWLITCKDRRGKLKTTIFAFFDKDALMAAVPQNGDKELKVAGKLKSGQYFYGCDTVRIIDWKWNWPWCQW
jgi:predicted MPP superfamily phosphohydrolase